MQQPFSQRSKRTLISPNRKRGLRVVFHTPTKMMHAQKRLQRNKRHSLLPTPESLCSRLSARGIRRSALLSLQSHSPRGSAVICSEDSATTFFSKIEKNSYFSQHASEACVLFSIHPQRYTHKDDACAKKTPTKQTSLLPSDSGKSMQSVICAGNRVWIGGAHSFLYSRTVPEAAR